MSSPRILYYVSGHGFGHARRSAEVIRQILVRAPDASIRVRTSARPDLFAPLPPESVEPCDIDAGMAERGTLTIDPAGTLDRLRNLIGRSGEIVATEVGVVREFRPNLLLADIPFLAGDVAHAAGVPCVAISNFTWDWICDPLLSAEPAYTPIRERMRQGYSRMTSVLKLPVGHVSDAFSRRIDVPLIASRSKRNPRDVLGAIGIASDDGRPRILIGLRGGIEPAAIRHAAAESPDYLFLLPNAEADPALPPNVVAIPTSAGVAFTDLVSASDVVLSKLGYGIFSDCIAAGVRLLWPRRTGFREDEWAEQEGPLTLRMRELPLQDFRAGSWRDSVDRLLASPPPPQSWPTDGANCCADLILRRVGECW